MRNAIKNVNKTLVLWLNQVKEPLNSLLCLQIVLINFSAKKIQTQPRIMTAILKNVLTISLNTCLPFQLPQLIANLQNERTADYIAFQEMGTSKAEVPSTLTGVSGSCSLKTPGLSRLRTAALWNCSSLFQIDALTVASISFSNLPMMILIHLLATLTLPRVSQLSRSPLYRPFYSICSGIPVSKQYLIHAVSIKSGIS